MRCQQQTVHCCRFVRFRCPERCTVSGSSPGDPAVSFYLWSGIAAMNFDHHAFISYAHIDNEPLTAGQKGWVAQFHATLQTMLSQRLGERARIWRDDKLD